MWPKSTVLSRARQLRGDQTQAEAILWNCLRAGRLGGLKFHRQHPIQHYIADFVCRPAMLIVELDGVSHEGKVAYDRRRQEDLEALGYMVLRFKNNDLRALERVLRKIENVARDRIAAGVKVKRY